jgi:hypothetical protein
MPLGETGSVERVRRTIGAKSGGKRMTKSRIMTGAAALLAASTMLSASAALAQISGDTVKIGLMNDQ